MKLLHASHTCNHAIHALTSAAAAAPATPSSRTPCGCRSISSPYLRPQRRPRDGVTKWPASCRRLVFVPLGFPVARTVARSGPPTFGFPAAHQDHLPSPPCLCLGLLPVPLREDDPPVTSCPSPTLSFPASPCSASR